MPKYSNHQQNRTVSWPLLPDELTITKLFTIRDSIREKIKNAKTQWAMSFGQGHARGAYSSNCFLKRFFFLLNKVQRRLLDMNRDGF